jgi:hypothetical protein
MKMIPHGKSSVDQRFGEWFLSLIVVGIVMGLLAFLGIYVTSNPLAFVVIIAPSILIIGYITFTIHSYVRIFRDGIRSLRIICSLSLSLVSIISLALLGFVIWNMLWKSSPYIGP